MISPFFEFEDLYNKLCGNAGIEVVAKEHSLPIAGDISRLSRTLISHLASKAIFSVGLSFWLLG
jgi:hypothetical protein